VLDRAPTSGELTTYTAVYTNNGNSAKEVVRQLGYTAEVRPNPGVARHARTLTFPRCVRVQYAANSMVDNQKAARLMYRRFLCREAESQAAIDGHANNIATHGQQAGVNAFVDSPEYSGSWGTTYVPCNKQCSYTCTMCYSTSTAGCAGVCPATRSGPTCQIYDLTCTWSLAGGGGSCPCNSGFTDTGSATCSGERASTWPISMR
jgi:hypothetical protein